MTGDWRRLGLAALAAMAVAVACVTHVEAQAPAKTAAKKAPTKEADAEHAEEGEDAAKKPPKKKRQDPVEAQRAIDEAHKLLEAGKSDQAAQALTTVLGGGNLPPAIMAKALLYRGIAYRQQKKPALAIADLTSALWLKGGLLETERNDALKQRTSAYQEAGLADTSEPIAPAVPAARATRTASASEAVTSPQAQAAPTQSSGGWNPFAGWFGGSSSAPPPPAPPPAPSTTASIPPPQAAPAAAPAGPKSSGWSSSTEVRSGPEPAAAVVAAAKPEGRFRIQVGMVRTQSEAQSLVVRVQRDHGAVLDKRQPEIDETPVGNMGSFYRVRIGPFASAQESQAACAKLKVTGIDCLVVAQ